MSSQVVVTGLGAVTPIGIGVEEFWRGLIAGKNGVSEITAFDTSSYPNHRGGQIKDFDPNRYLQPQQVKRLGRGSQLAVVAAKMAMENAGITELSNPQRAGVCLGTTYGEAQALELMDRQWSQNGIEGI